MMNIQLDPITRHKIAEFAQRRRRMLQLRGLCAGLLTLLGAAIIVALVDWMFVMEDASRWVLSFGAYATVVGAVWMVSLRHLMRLPGERALARMIEAGAPEMREDLISAVELGGEEVLAKNDSPVFRALLQRSVASRAQGLRPDSLLPPRLLRVWIGTAAAIIVLFFGLFFVPGLRFHRLIVRAMLPMANMDRVSNTLVTVVEPFPNDPMVPRGDAVAIRVELSGAETEKVVLEVFDAQGRREPILMQATGVGRRYLGSVAADQEKLEFRIRANDALTRRYTISSRLRPYVSEFAKTYAYPEYAGMEPKTVVENSGDLSAWEGTTATIAMKTDQPIASAWMEVEQGGKLGRYDLEVGPDKTHVTGRMKMAASGAYKVHLKAAETGFENTFNPTYELSARADAVPLVAIARPEKDMMAAADEIVSLEGVAKDDMALRKVSHDMRINEGPWKETVLTTDRVAEFPVMVKWDLYDLGLKTGDRVTTRLAAVDLKGSRVESKAVTVMIGAVGFSPRELAAIQARRDLLAALEAYRKAAEELRKSNLPDAARKLGDEADRVREAVRLALVVVEMGADSYEVSLVGRLIDRVRALDPSLAALDRAVEDARLGRDWLKQLLEADETAALGEDLAALVEDQKRVSADVKGDAASAELWKRRQGVAIRQIQLLEERHKEFGKTYPEGAHHAREAAVRLQQAREKMEAAMAVGKTGSLDHRLAEARDLMLGYGRQRAERADQVRRDLAGRTRESFRLLESLTSPRAFETALAGLEARAKNEELRPDADRAFVADADLAKRAVEAMQKDANPDRIRDVLAAFRTLEIGHELAELSAHLTRTVTDERWHFDAPGALTGRPEQWDWAASQMRESPPKFDQTPFPKEARALVEQARDSNEAQRVRNQLELRRTKGRDGVRVDAPMGRVSQSVAKANELIQEEMRKARAVLAKTAPTLSEMMKELAQKVEKVQEKTEKAAQEAAQKPAEQAKAEAREILQKQDALQKDVQELADALKREAGKQDLMQEEGRERARDADDAKAMVEEDAKQALEATAEAAAAPQPKELNEAAKEQGEMAKTLNELAKHFENLEQGKDVAKSREALREAEKELGIRDELQKQYDQAAKLAELAQKAPAEALAQLEEELKRNEEMRRELDELAGDSAQNAQQQLEQASKQEAAVAQKLDQAAQQDRQGNQQAAQKLQEIGKKAEALAQQKVPPVDQAAKAAQNESAPKLAEAAKALEQAAAQQQGAQAEAMKAAAQEAKQAAAEAAQSGKEAQAQAAEANKDLQQGAQQAKQAQASDPAAELAREAQATAQALKEAAADLQKAANEQGETAKEAGQAKDAAAQQAEAAAKQAAEAKQSNNSAAEQAAKASQKAAQQAQQAAQAAEKGAQKAQQGAQQAAQEAAQLAAQAEQLAGQMAQEAQADAGQLAQAAAQQQQIAGQVAEAGEMLERVARHEERLGQQETAQALGEVAKGVEQVAQKDIPAAAQALQQAPSNSQGSKAAAQAQQQIDAQAQALAQAAQAAQGTTPPAPNAGESQFPAEAAESLAQMLDQLDQSLNGQPGQKGQQPGQGQPQPGEGPPSEAMAQAAESQAQSMAQGRNGQKPGQQKGKPNEGFSPESKMGADTQGAAAVGKLGDAGKLKDGQWGKLPPKLARDLMEGRREQIPGEYRPQVDAYFKAIAEKARENK